MARTTKATTARRTKAAVAPKKLGRPVSSKSRAPVAPKKAAVAPKKAITRRAAPVAAPTRMNKAELEAQVIKLERSIARAKAQNAELKAALKAAQQPAEVSPAPVASKTGKKAGAAPAKRTRRTKAEMAAAAEVTAPEVEQPEE